MIIYPTKVFKVRDSSAGIEDGIWNWAPGGDLDECPPEDLRVIVVEDGVVVAHMTNQFAARVSGGTQLLIHCLNVSKKPE